MTIVLTTDGGYRATLSKGSWAWVAQRHGAVKLLHLAGGVELGGSSGRMELFAVLNAIAWAHTNHVTDEVIVVSDSEYVVKAFEEGWLERWVTDNWYGSNGKQVKNQDLWKQLRVLTLGMSVRFYHVRGHQGHPANELCDELCTTLLQSDVIGIADLSDLDVELL